MRLATLLLALLVARPGQAQRLEPVTVARRYSTTLSGVEPTVPIETATPAARATWWAPLASAALPGAGQAALHQDRFVAYLAVEAFSWVRVRSDLREAKRERRAYRALARRVARADFPGEHPDGDWTYYERMEHWVESGAYDLSPGDAVDPETDVSTFNGSTWLLARQTYWSDPATPPPVDSPAYRSAIDFYVQRAIRPAYRWSWRNAQLEQDVFDRTIARSNTAFRRSVQDLGVLIANHALSTVDAYVTLRIRVHASADGLKDLTVTIPWDPFRPRAPRVP